MPTETDYGKRTGENEALFRELVPRCGRSELPAKIGASGGRRPDPRLLPGCWAPARSVRLSHRVVGRLASAITSESRTMGRRGSLVDRSTSWMRREVRGFAARPAGTRSVPLHLPEEVFRVLARRPTAHRTAAAVRS
jgi:hypothetical protein